MKPSMRRRYVLLLAGVLANANAQALPTVAQQSTIAPAATGRAIIDPVNPEAVAAATKATDHWLAIVDEGKFADSWKDAAVVFRLGVTETEWVTELEAIRARLGRTTMRELRAAKFSTTVRGAPLTGEYVTLSYLTQFANAPIAAETLIVSKEADGEWRIAGYTIGKAPDQ